MDPSANGKEWLMGAKRTFGTVKMAASAEGAMELAPWMGDAALAALADALLRRGGAGDAVRLHLDRGALASDAAYRALAHRACVLCHANGRAAEAVVEAEGLGAVGLREAMALVASATFDGMLLVLPGRGELELSVVMAAVDADGVARGDLAA